MNIIDIEKMFLSQQQSPAEEKVSLKHQLLQVIVRVAQYRMLLTGEYRLSILLSIFFVLNPLEAFITFTPLTDYLNNLSPDSKEYEDTQGMINKL